MRKRDTFNTILKNNVPSRLFATFQKNILRPNNRFTYTQGDFNTDGDVRDGTVLGGGSWFSKNNSGHPEITNGYPLIRELRRRVQAGDFGAMWRVSGLYLSQDVFDPEKYVWHFTPGTVGGAFALMDYGVHWFVLA